jgi:hypothetical protein
MPVVPDLTVAAGAAVADFALGFGVACDVCVDDTLEDAEGNTSPAQAGITIKTNKSIIIFMVSPLLTVNEKLLFHCAAQALVVTVRSARPVA